MRGVKVKVRDNRARHTGIHSSSNRDQSAAKRQPYVEIKSTLVINVGLHRSDDAVFLLILILWVLIRL